MPKSNDNKSDGALAPAPEEADPKSKVSGAPVEDFAAGALRASMPFLGLMPEAVAVEAEHAGFGAGEECRAQQQKDQQSDQKAGV